MPAHFSMTADELVADAWRWYVGTLDQRLFDWFAGLRTRGLRTGILSNSGPGAREAERHYGFETVTDDLDYERAYHAAVRAVTPGRLREVAARWLRVENATVAALLPKSAPHYKDAEEKLQKAIKLCTSRWKRPSPESSPAGSKAAGLYIICTLAKDEALAAGYQDALMHDYRGRLSEATGANLFLVLNGELHTPTTETILNGITRLTVMDLARKRGLKVVEREIWPDELAKASEVFLTGTAVEVQPVGAIDSREYPVGPVTRQLKDDYAAAVRA